MSILPRLAVFLLAVGLALPATAGVAEDERARNAVRVLNEIQAIPESGIPDVLFDEAKAIVVVPDTLKIGLVIGGRRGHGLVSVKNPDGTWSNPAFVKLTGGSIGFQAGVQSSDVVLVFTSQRGLDSIVNGKITLGADASIAAGPVGRTTGLATDGRLKAEIWSWSRARGLFAGVALDGAVLSIDDDANQAVYGAGTTPRMIFENRAPQRPSDAVVTFRDQLEEATAAAHAARGPSTPAPRPAPPEQSPAVAPRQPAVTQPQPQPFEPVDSPYSSSQPAVRTEPLPPDP
ncbi:lipid-binding SYLF domain-containing protein [Novilysobacter arseniciresistens]|uniref:lipid-binding SYLF domain-containing protein n=1 Tax=Novilysobacter arseniciresistens TaxID=1385522 RepID=UPI00056D54EF|nr:lipid-binding SYLF domain-containing protein [Lysobacter arseniciresistens]